MTVREIWKVFSGYFVFVRGNDGIAMQYDGNGELGDKVATNGRFGKVISGDTAYYPAVEVSVE